MAVLLDADPVGNLLRTPDAARRGIGHGGRRLGLGLPLETENHVAQKLSSWLSLYASLHSLTAPPPLIPQYVLSDAG